MGFVNLINWLPPKSNKVLFGILSIYTVQQLCTPNQTVSSNLPMLFWFMCWPLARSPAGAASAAKCLVMTITTSSARMAAAGSRRRLANLDQPAAASLTRFRFAIVSRTKTTLWAGLVTDWLDMDILIFFGLVVFVLNLGWLACRAKLVWFGLGSA